MILRVRKIAFNAASRVFQLGSQFCPSHNDLRWPFREQLSRRSNIGLNIELCRTTAKISGNNTQQANLLRYQILHARQAQSLN